MKHGGKKAGRRTGLHLNGKTELYPRNARSVLWEGTPSGKLAAEAALSGISIFLLLSGILLELCRGWNLMWQNTNLSWLLLIALLAAVFACLCEKRGYLILPVLGVLLFEGWRQWDVFLGGAYKLANAFLDSINYYYGTKLPAFEILGAADSGLLLLYLMAWLGLFLALAQIRRKSRIETVLPGLLVISMGLLVGKSPDTTAFICMAGGTVLAFAGMGERKVKTNSYVTGLLGRNSFYAGAVFLLALALFAVYGASLEQTVQGRHDEMLAFQKELEQRVEGVSLFSTRSNGQDGKITNQEIKYTGKTVFTVTLEEAPYQTMYFRGFVGDTYEDGKWYPPDEQDFLKAAKQWNSYREDIGADILQLSYNSKYAEDKTIWTQAMKLDYRSEETDYAYVPYYTYLRADGVLDLLNVSADSTLYRTKACDQIYLNIYLEQEENAITALDEADVELDADYSTYVKQHYAAEHSTQLKRLNALADEWKEQGFGAFEGDFEYTTQTLKVLQELWDRTSYNRKLQSIPAGEDVVENFLFDSNEGYCIHYASAATLLLRELGVPVRYVSGYAVTPQEFKKNSDGTYTAAVPDWDGHAWVEIYVDHKGWIPMEVTEGSAREDYTGGISGGTGAAQQPEAQKQEAPDTETAMDTEAQNTQKDSAGLSQNGSGKMQMSRKLMLAVFMAAFVLACGVGLWKVVLPKRSRMLLARTAAGGDTRKAVLALSHAVYKEVRRAGLIKEKELWDEEYIRILEAKFSFLQENELRKFMECARKTAFSPYVPPKEVVLEGIRIYDCICRAIHEKKI